MKYILQIILGIAALAMWSFFLDRLDKIKGAGYGVLAAIFLGIGYIVFVLFNPGLIAFGMIICFLAWGAGIFASAILQESWGFEMAFIFGLGILFFCI